jgi:hypothetical protein
MQEMLIHYLSFLCSCTRGADGQQGGQKCSIAMVGCPQTCSSGRGSIDRCSRSVAFPPPPLLAGLIALSPADRTNGQLVLRSLATSVAAISSSLLVGICFLCDLYFCPQTTRRKKNYYEPNYPRTMHACREVYLVAC